METLKLFITRSGKTTIYVTIEKNGLQFFSYPSNLNNTLKEKGVKEYSVTYLSNEVRRRIEKRLLDK